LRHGAQRHALRKLLMMAKDPLELPDDLPVPEDDGAADHLVGAELPPVALEASDGTSVRLDQLGGRSVVFAYPRTGRPGEPSLGGDEEWDAIPGARGCTPQACSFRDEYARFEAAGTRVLGLSTQDTAYQQEATERLQLPYPLLSDERLELATALRLPTFEVDGITLLKRLTLFVRDGVIESVNHPVFPPNPECRAGARSLSGLTEFRAAWEKPYACALSDRPANATARPKARRAPNSGGLNRRTISERPHVDCCCSCRRARV
jgi:peroxiredoxin